jgi:hypothetical protein
MKITVNENQHHADSVREALRKKNGYCPCVINPTEDDLCMCKEFRDKISDPDFEGWCNCNLYFKEK